MPEVGQTVTCAETGKAFVVTTDGFTFNYAQDDAGNVYSDEGVDLREKRELLDRSRPFVGYLSSDGNHLTGWKGNILGRVVSRSTVRLTRWSYIHGRTIEAVRIRDIHGRLWYGRGNPGIAITIRAMKG
jgi:hypothetical protein